MMDLLPPEDMARQAERRADVQGCLLGLAAIVLAAAVVFGLVWFIAGHAP